MALVKCPRCELNYILDGDSLCTVCRRDVRGEVTEVDDLPELCSECGELPAVAGGDLCLLCLKDMNRRSGPSVATEDTIDVVEDTTLEIESVSTMDEIEIDIADDIEEEGFERLLEVRLETCLEADSRRKITLTTVDAQLGADLKKLR